MTRHVTFDNATIKDVSYVMAWLKPKDLEETLCQLAEGAGMQRLGYALLMSGDTYVARYRDNPAMVFGVQAMNVSTMQVWALGTKDTWRVASAVVDYFVNRLVPHYRAQGYYAMEARSLATHHEAHLWMKASGAEQHGPPYEYGRGREKFLTFRWQKPATDGKTTCNGAAS